MFVDSVERLSVLDDMRERAMIPAQESLEFYRNSLLIMVKLEQRVTEVEPLKTTECQTLKVLWAANSVWSLDFMPEATYDSTGHGDMRYQVSYGEFEEVSQGCFEKQIKR